MGLCFYWLIDMLNIRFFLFLVLSLFTSQSYGAIWHSGTEQFYGYDAVAQHDKADVTVEINDLSIVNHQYDGSSNLSLCCSKRLVRTNRQNASEGYFFALVSGFNVTKGAPKSLKDQAADLIPQNANKNRVTLRSPSQKMEVDLAGRTHGDVPTPHTKVSPRNLKAPNQPAYNTKNSPVRPATQQDIRTVRRYLERQGQQ